MTELFKTNAIFAWIRCGFGFVADILFGFWFGHNINTYLNFVFSCRSRYCIDGHCSLIEQPFQNGFGR